MTDDPTLPARPSRRSPSAQTLRLGKVLRPHLLRWAAAQTREERVCAWVEALTGLRMGNVNGSPSISFGFDGDIARVLIFNAALSVSDRALVRAYLASLYGVTV